MVICTYARLFAAYHVLHRLHEPRHPPCALHYFCFHGRLVSQPALVPDAATITLQDLTDRSGGGARLMFSSTVLLVS